MVTTTEMEMISSMFHYFDHTNSGRIHRNLAMKILLKVGIKSKDVKLPTELSLPEIISTIEYLSPKAEKTLSSQLDSFHLMMNPDYRADIAMVNSESIARMLRGGGASRADVQNLLESMMEWDDCSHEPYIKCSRFNDEVIRFNATKQSKLAAGRRNRVKLAP